MSGFSVQKQCPHMKRWLKTATARAACDRRRRPGSQRRCAG
jgi:hypothetical protein